MCLFKMIFDLECFNCGMTRAFLSIIKLEFNEAIMYNKNVVFVFPSVVLAYAYFCYRYIKKE